MSEIVAKITNLSHKYKDVVALEDINLELPKGKMIGLIGPDGVGKSTLLAILSGTKIIQKGRVEVLNFDISIQKARDIVCPKVAYMPQGLGKNLYITLSVYENIKFFAKLFGLDKQQRKKRILQLLQSTDLIKFKERPAGKLSGGMKQKLGLCCSLIHDPEILILDEPTTGVDPLSRREFWKVINLIKNKNKNMSGLIATAYMKEEATFDSIIAMDDRKILMNGTLQDILKNTNSLDRHEAFIKLLPDKKRVGYEKLVVPKKDYKTIFRSIEVENLSMKFGDFTAVDSVNLNIKEGEIFGFLGSNGCGKTTTMKMLTGLLTPSSGNAKLFGEELKDSSFLMKEKVGYMTQAFSLYSELSILENIELHAKLFHIKNQKKRVEYLLEKFNLKEYKDFAAKELPLGIKQRLSLAVAVIHSPKMLILDEPTSGVDPVSRDSFWELLVDLSRKESVTIFISTHFMNEGERCDRISLMHKGKVLVSNTPENLIKEKNKTNLEDTFIEYLEEAIDENENSKIDIKDEIDLRSESQIIQNSFFSLNRVFAYSFKETLELLRDRVRLTFALFGTIILMAVIGYGVSFDVENLSFAVLDQDKSPTSQNYIQNISGSRYFIEKDELSSFSELDEKMKSGKISVAFVIPPDFGRNLAKNHQEEIAVWVDGTFPFRAETINGYVKGLHYTYISNYAKESLGIESKQDINIIVRYRYNQDFKSIYSMVPAVLAMLLIFIPAILVALSVVREKELGSITNFYATPVTRFEFLIGKQIPYIFISLISYLGLILFAIFIFQVPLKGSFFTLTFGAFLYIFCTTTLGLFMSSFAKTQIVALAGTAIFTLLPTIQFSGLKEPVSSLEGIAQYIGNVFPVTYFINISRGVFSKNVTFSDSHLEFFILAITSVVIYCFAILVLNKQEK